MLRHSYQSKMIGAGIALMAVLVAGCGDDDGCCYVDAPTPTPTDTVVVPTDTVPPVPSPTPTATVAPSRLVEITPGATAADAILEALITAEPGDVIHIRAGTYHLTNQLSLDVDNVTIRGDGIDSTILSFAGQTQGGEGLLVTGDQFLIEDIALIDGPGDLLKIVGTTGLIIRRTRAEWTNGPSTDNGAYGFYPVDCTNVVVEESVVKGASDAGFYIGQSHNIIVRNNLAQFNVAGIEIENCTDADVYGNLATNNAGGILVFNMPGLPFLFGRTTRVFRNDIFENNTPNFGAPGTSVSAVPTGTGLMILANDQVEVFDNHFLRNDTSQVLLISFNTAALVGGFSTNDRNYDRYAESVFIHDNVYEEGGTRPEATVASLIGGIVGGLPFPDILYDGDVDSRKLVEGSLPANLRTCIQEPQVTLWNIDLRHSGSGASPDQAPFNCTLAHLPAIVIPGAGDSTGPRPTAQPTPTQVATPTATPVPGRMVEIEPGEGAQDALLLALIDARPGDLIHIKEGTYRFDGAISLDVDDVTVRGDGMDKTILSFADQSTGGEGFLVTGDRFVIEDIALEDSPGDLLKLVGSEGVTIRRVRTEWTNGPATDNGAYGLYPVQCTNVLIEDSIVRGASDAGFYVGQSDNIILRRNLAEFNVAGIEIENSTDADVYDNLATNNAGGILIFNLPGLPMIDGRRTRVFNNRMIENNYPNFAAAGTIVSGVPTGTGLMILANDQVEVFENTFEDNNTTHILLVSWNTAATAGGFSTNDRNYDRYSESLYILDNSYAGGGIDPHAGTDELIGSIVGHPFPQILFDGDIDRRKLVGGVLPDNLRTCIQDPSATFWNVDLSHVGAFASPDPAPFNCSHERLQPVVIAGANGGTPTPTPEMTAVVATPTPVSGVETRCRVSEGSAVNFDVTESPCDLLSSYRFFVAPAVEQQPNGGVVPYDLNTQLFSDYTVKRRFVYLPPGQSAVYNDSESLEFPVGTVIIKTFAYPHDLRDPLAGDELIETRLLIHREHGWVALPYLWNQDKSEARLKLVGATVQVSGIQADGETRSVSYSVPNANQCKGCHNEHNDTTAPLGPKARNLNKDYDYGDAVENQLSHWGAIGILSGAPAPAQAPRLAPFDNPASGTLEQRARGYLDVNCGGCHNPSGPARTSGLFLTIHETDPTHLGICKSPVAAGRGTGGFHSDIVPGSPETSILTFRMGSTEPGIAMPELGRRAVHAEGLAVVSEWIDSLAGECQLEEE